MVSSPANYLEISVNDPVTHGEGRTRFTDFRMEMKTNMPVFKVSESGWRMRDKMYLIHLLGAAERSFCEEALLRVQMVAR